MDSIAKVYQINQRLWAVDEIGRTTMYVYAGEKKALLLDTGLGLLDLRQLVTDLCPGREIIPVNTHAHGDHTSGNGQFDQVWVGRLDAATAAKGMSAEEEKQFREHFIDCSPVLNKAQKSAWKPGVSPVVHPLQDGDVIDLGGIRLEVLETPGHTRGSICLFDREAGILFTGDMLLTWCVWGHLRESAPLHEYGRSIHRLAMLGDGVKTVCPAHGVAGNPFGWPIWYLSPEVIPVYDEGIGQILAGTLQGRPYSCFLGDGMVADFAIGGITYRADAL